MAMETRAITARWDADLRQLTVWSTTQAPQILRRMLARFLGLAEHAVRVVTQDIGGGFGPKAIVYSEDILVPYLARALGRPVRFVESRREHLLAVTQERDQWHEAELGLTRDGRIVALRDTFVHDCGAFVSWGVIVPLITSVSVPGPYRVANYEVTFTAAYTNRVPVTPVRGAGRPQAVFVMERLLDLAAARLGSRSRGDPRAQPDPARRVPLRCRPRLARQRPAPLRQRKLSRVPASRDRSDRLEDLHPRPHQRATRGTRPRALRGGHRARTRTRASACAWSTTGASSSTREPPARARRTRPRWPRSSPTGSRCRSSRSSWCPAIPTACRTASARSPAASPCSPAPPPRTPPARCAARR